MQLILSEFQRFELTPEEQQLARVFNEFQLANLHNLRTEALTNKMNLQFTPNDINLYLQNEAAIQGQINILTYLIESSNN